MKTISHILSLVLPDIKPEYIYMQLLFITLFFKVGWIVLATSLTHAIKTFIHQYGRGHSQVTDRLSLCH